MNKFYVYEWFNTKTGEVFYVGKGCGKRAYEIHKRNQIFQEYYNANNVDVRIIKDKLSEEDAFKLEAETIQSYKNNNQCIANITEGGYGGCNFVWTDEMREYKSKYNPMKREEQRQRMRENNPMKDPKIAEKVGKQGKRPIIVKGKRYDGTVDAARDLNITTQTVLTWLRRGFDSNNIPCRYEDEQQKDFTPIKRGRSVIIDDIEYRTGAEAAKALGVTPSAISYALKHNGICKGHKCRYANQQPSQ